MLKWLLMTAALTVALVAGIACGEEAAAEVVKVNDGSVNIPTWLQFVFSFEFVWKGLVTGGGLLIGWLFKLVIGRFKEDALAKEALAALQGGVIQTYEDFVREAKKAAADGKLTKEEREAARNQAIENAKAAASDPVKSLLIKWGKARLSAYIAQIVAKMKKGKTNAGEDGEAGKQVPGD
jgi:hypothetical protein